VTTYELDDVDKRLLTLLQEDARYTALELAERIGVSDNTIHNRMDRLEEAGIITGYTTTIDHDRTGLDLYFAFTCTARISERSAMAEDILEIPEVLEVTELMTGEHNLLVKAVGGEDEDISRVAEQVDQLDVEINDENLIREQHTKALDYVEIEAMIDGKD
jgi:DNA-binding Lrp family transcriptional regulator